jgi:hypothetical protein
MASAAQEGRANTQRRVEIVKRKKRVKKKFASVINRVSLMSKLGATFDTPIHEEHEEFDEEEDLIEEEETERGEKAGEHTKVTATPNVAFKNSVLLSPDEASASDTDGNTPVYRAPATLSMYDVSDTDISDSENMSFRSPLMDEGAPTPVLSPAGAGAATADMFILSPDRESDLELTPPPQQQQQKPSEVIKQWNQLYDLSDDSSADEDKDDVRPADRAKTTTDGNYDLS